MASRNELDQNSFVHVVKRRDEIESDISLLDESEMERHDRYLDVKKKDEFVVGRAFIKTELAKVLEINPGEVELSLSENGKPYCAREGEELIHFNLSHGGDYFVLGLSLKPIGVDLEKKREVALEVMQPILSESEYLQLADVPDEERSMEFLKLFTAKEAFIKATDKKYGLDEIAFSFSEGDWQLVSPQSNCSFQHIEHEDLIIAVSIDLG